MDLPELYERFRRSHLDHSPETQKIYLSAVLKFTGLLSKAVADITPLDEGGKTLWINRDECLLDTGADGVQLLPSSHWLPACEGDSFLKGDTTCEPARDIHHRVKCNRHPECFGEQIRHAENHTHYRGSKHPDTPSEVEMRHPEDNR